MPALANPRHERFAFLIFAALSGETKHERAASTAYLQAYPSNSGGNSAEAAASRLLRKVKPIAARVAELQQEAEARHKPKIDVSRDRIARRLDRASSLAESVNNAAAMVSAELGIGKVFGHITDKVEVNNKDLGEAKTLEEMGRILLRNVGMEEDAIAAAPSCVQSALQANDRFISELELIRDRASGLVLEHDADTASA